MSDHYLSQIGGRSEANRPLSVAPENLNGAMRIAQGNVVVDAAQNDTIGLFPLPSDAVLSHQVSLFAFTALGAAVTANVGFAARSDIGFAGVDDALVAAEDVAAAGSASLTKALTIADLGKRVWELAGLAADPGGEFWIEAILEAANPASGTIGIEQAYVTK